MARGVFLHRTNSIYEDEPERQYQFPHQYLSRASQFIDDWIIYYEPRRGPTGRGYFAIARVEKIIPDPSAANMYLALIEPGSYLEFEQAVPFSSEDGPIERGVLNEAGRIRVALKLRLGQSPYKILTPSLSAGCPMKSLSCPGWTYRTPVSRTSVHHSPLKLIGRGWNTTSRVRSGIARFGSACWMLMIADAQ